MANDNENPLHWNHEHNDPSGFICSTCKYWKTVKKLGPYNGHCIKRDGHIYGLGVLPYKLDQFSFCTWEPCNQTIIKIEKEQEQ